jgi:hypothetical protein
LHCYSLIEILKVEQSLRRTGVFEHVGSAPSGWNNEIRTHSAT